ncbi:citrate synthase [Thermomicrobiaceae bacterium CFH 74404]|uniref:Citrate synthase n=1 Tax=Thermalbibacter longus TaxID=2951981 RepID=A0AA41WFX8_9BACT|nr:citrate synthase [Thermalbibacter longus]MCM8749665.1 citrate synthase [Thermalbibacter longus]
MAEEVYRPGLEGVIATETAISFLDVEREEIVVRGYNLLDLARERTYVDVVGLLIDGRLPDDQERAVLERRLLAAAEVPAQIWEILRLLPPRMHAMDRLRTAISTLGGFDPGVERVDPEQDRESGLRIVAQAATIVANLVRVREGQQPLAPDPSRSFPANFLWMITGRDGSPAEVRVFDQALIAYSEHELPNSTFAARVIASTLADVYGALTGAVASLKGPLHGGANEAVMAMLLEAGDEEGIERWIRERLARKERIMGFGHRVYMRRMDPRAQLLKETLTRLVAERGDAEGQKLLRMCERAERLMHAEKGLYPNLDYYAAPVFYVLGIPIELYTPIFFAARTAGLVAHVVEQHAHNRLFRPRVRYTGPRGLKPA